MGRCEKKSLSLSSCRSTTWKRYLTDWHFIASQEIRATFKQHICDMQFNAVAVALKSWIAITKKLWLEPFTGRLCGRRYKPIHSTLSQFSKIVPVEIAYLRYAVCGCCLCIKNANCYKKAGMDRTISIHSRFSALWNQLESNAYSKFTYTQQGFLFY